MKIKEEYIIFIPKNHLYTPTSQNDLTIVKVYELVNEFDILEGYVMEKENGSREKIPIHEFNKILADNEKYFNLTY